MNLGRKLRCHRQYGISYIEIMVATLLITVALVPMMEALGPGLQGSQVHRDLAETNFVLQGKLEQVLAESFDELDAAASKAGDFKIATVYSDTGSSVPHEVFIWRYDIDNADADDNEFTGGEDDILWVRVAAVGAPAELQTLISRY